MSLFDELPKEFVPLAVLGEINGYLHIYSGLDDDTLLAIIDMAGQAVEDRQYDVNTTVLQ
jgi:hypothetical protein